MTTTEATETQRAEDAFVALAREQHWLKLRQGEVARARAAVAGFLRHRGVGLPRLAELIGTSKQRISPMLREAPDVRSFPDLPVPLVEAVAEADLS